MFSADLYVGSQRLKFDYRRFGRFLVRAAPGCLLAALLTVVCFRLHLSFATTGFLYLVVVVLQSLTGNFVSSALVSSVAVLCLDYSQVLSKGSSQEDRARSFPAQVHSHRTLVWPSDVQSEAAYGVPLE